MENDIRKYIIYRAPSFRSYKREVLLVPVIIRTIEDRSDKNFKIILFKLWAIFSIEYEEIKRREITIEYKYRTSVFIKLT